MTSMTALIRLIVRAIALGAVASPFVDAQDFRFEKLDGTKFDARLVEWTADKIVVADRAGERSLSASEVAGFESRTVAKPLRSPVTVLLADGSSIRATEIAFANGTCSFKTLAGAELKLPAEAVLAARLREASRETDDSWRSAVGATDVAGDRIVIRREAAADGGATSVALDYREGVIQSIGAETVDFEREGRVLKVKRERLEGVLLFRKRPADPPASLGRIDDIDGDQWTVASVVLGKEGVRVTTPSGATVDLPMSAWKRADLSDSNAKFLTVADGVVERPLLFAIPGLEDVEKQVSDVADKPAFVGQVRMADVDYDKALQLPPKGSAAFLTPAGMRRFQATVGFEDSVVPQGSVKLIVELDGKPTLEKEFGPARGEPATISVDLNGAQRLNVRVEPVSGARFGARLTMALARFTR